MKKIFFSRLYLTIKKISIKIYNNKLIISTFTNKNITKHSIIYEKFKNHSLNFNQDYGILKMRHYMAFNNPVKALGWMLYYHLLQKNITPLKKKEI